MGINIVNYLGSKLDIVAAILCILGGLGAIIVSTVIGGGQHGLGLALLVPAVAFLFIDTRSPATEIVRTSNLRLTQCSTILFFIIISLGIFIGSFVPYDRPTIHFLLLSVGAALILTDIYLVESTSRATALALFKIALLSIGFKVVRLTNYSTIPGSDIHYHYRFADVIMSTGSLPSGELTSKYVITPVWHLWMVAVRSVTSVSHEGAIIATIFIPFTISIVVIGYAIARQFTGHREMSLIVALLISVGDMFILRGATNITPSSIAIIFTLAMLLLILLSNDSRSFLLILLFLGASILTHQLSTFVLILIIIAICIISQTYRLEELGKARSVNRKIPLTLILSSGLILFLHWGYGTYGGAPFFDKMIPRLMAALSGLFESSGTAYTDGGASHSLLSDLLYNPGYNIILGFGVFGMLYSLRSTLRNEYKIGFIVSAGTLFALIYPLTLVGFDQVFLPHRMLVFLQLFAVLYAGIAIHLFIASSPRRRHLVAGSFVVFLLVFASLTTPYLNRDAPVYNEERVERSELTQKEVDAHLWTMSVNSSEIYTDPKVSARVLQTEYERSGEQSTRGISSYEELPDEGPAMMIVRLYIENREAIEVSGTFGQSRTIEIDKIINRARTEATVYDNGNTRTVWIPKE